MFEILFKIASALCGMFISTWEMVLSVCLFHPVWLFGTYEYKLQEMCERSFDNIEIKERKFVKVKVMLSK